MFVQQFLTGGDRNFGYLAADETSGLAMAVDPSYNPEEIAAFAQQHGYKLEYVLCTHGHADHTDGAERMEKLADRKPLVLGLVEPVTGQKIADGTRLPLGKQIITIIHTPGHTPESMCMLAGTALFTGDTLFAGKIGGTWSDADARAEYESLHQKLLVLPDDTVVYPGHHYGTTPQSTIGHEKQTNPFLLCRTFEEFLHLKNNWAEYKKRHGIA